MSAFFLDSTATGKSVLQLQQRQAQLAPLHTLAATDMGPNSLFEGLAGWLRIIKELCWMVEGIQMFFFLAAEWMRRPAQTLHITSHTILPAYHIPSDAMPRWAQLLAIGSAVCVEYYGIYTFPLLSSFNVAV